MVLLESNIWLYESVIGMILYLSSNIQPDIEFAVHQAAIFTNCPSFMHEQAVERIGSDLKHTQDKGLIMD